MAAPKKVNPKSDLIKLRVTPDFKRNLQEMADKKEVPLSSLVSIWLKERLEEEKQK